MLYADEMHLIIDNHFQGYSLANTQTIMMYDTSLKHSIYSLVNFVEQSCDGKFKFSRSFLVTGSVDSKAFTDCLNKTLLDLVRNFGTKNLADDLKIWLTSAHKFQNT